MTQSSPRPYRVLGIILLLFAIVLAAILYFLVGPHALLLGAVPLLGDVVISILLLTGWPRQGKR